MNKIQQNSVLVNTPPPLFDLKVVYSYVIQVADSESDLGLHGKALVSEILIFLQLRVTYFSIKRQSIRGNASINTPSKKITPSKVNTLHTPS